MGGLFSEVGVEIDVTEDPNDGSNEGLDVTMKVKEPRRFTGGVHTLVGNNDGSLMVSFKTPNLFGRGEKLSVEYTHGILHQAHQRRPRQVVHRRLLPRS